MQAIKTFFCIMWNDVSIIYAYFQLCTHFLMYHSLYIHSSSFFLWKIKWYKYRIFSEQNPSPLSLKILFLLLRFGSSCTEILCCCFYPLPKAIRNSLYFLLVDATSQRAQSHSTVKENNAFTRKIPRFFKRQQNFLLTRFSQILRTLLKQPKKICVK